MHKHKPVRPKSAKGKTRPSKNNHNNTTLYQSNNASSNSHAVPASPNSSSSSRASVPSNCTARIKKAAASPADSASSSRVETPSSVDFPVITRPTSSLSRYRILPSISGNDFPSTGDSWLADVNAEMDGRISEMDLLTEQAQQMILDSSIQKSQKNPIPPSSAGKRKVTKTVSNGDNKRPKIYQTRSVFSSSRQNLIKEPPKPRVPKEPGPNETRILLALKLPDGTRVERYFHPHARLIGVLAYAHSQYPLLHVSQCNLFRMDVIPKKLLDRTDLSLEDVGIQHRTVLYVEEKDED